MTAVQQNLNIWSNDFTQGRTGANFAASVAGTGPDGTAASLLNDGVAAGVQHYIYQTATWVQTAGFVYTYSFCAKAGTGQYLKAAVNAGNRAIFDVLNGSLGTVDAGLVATIKPCYDSAGVLWGYRCRVTWTATVTASVVVYLMAAATSSDAYAATFNGANRTYTLWCEQRVFANWEGPLCPTFAKPVDNGRIRDIVGTVENRCTYSEDFTNAAWPRTNLAVPILGQADPFGGTGAVLFTDTVDAGPVLHYTRRLNTSGLTKGIRSTFSVYAKPGTKKYVYIYEQSSGYVIFDVLAGTVVAQLAPSVGRIESVGNGWYRCSVSVPNPTATDWILHFINSSGSGTYQGDGTGTWYVFGAQAVQAMWAGPYTRTVASAVIPGPTYIRDLA